MLQSPGETEQSQENYNLPQDPQREEVREVPPRPVSEQGHGALLPGRIVKSKRL